MAKQEEAKPIDLTERTTVYATEKNTHVKTGEAMAVAPAVAEKLIANGMATENAPSKTTEKGK